MVSLITYYSRAGCLVLAMKLYSIAEESKDIAFTQSVQITAGHTALYRQSECSG